MRGKYNGWDYRDELPVSLADKISEVIGMKRQRTT